MKYVTHSNSLNVCRVGTLSSRDVIANQGANFGITVGTHRIKNQYTCKEAARLSKLFVDTKSLDQVKFIELLFRKLMILHGIYAAQVSSIAVTIPENSQSTLLRYESVYTSGTRCYNVTV